MASQKSDVPKCPGCGMLLHAVYENEYWTYTSDKKSGTYKGDLVDIEIRCPDCHTCLRSEFPEGVCNYQAVVTSRNAK